MSWDKGYEVGHNLPLDATLQEGDLQAYGDREAFSRGLIEGRIDQLSRVLAGMQGKEIPF